MRGENLYLLNRKNLNAILFHNSRTLYVATLYVKVLYTYRQDVLASSAVTRTTCADEKLHIYTMRSEKLLIYTIFFVIG